MSTGLTKEALDAVNAGGTAVLGRPCPSCERRVRLVLTKHPAGGYDIEIFHVDPGCEFALTGGLRAWVDAKFKGSS